jgi:[ribosomal protein S5]-alanine N-acetyltransferase
MDGNVRLRYPAPDLSDGVVTLRRWSESDLRCIEEAATDPRISAGTTVPAVFSEEEGVAFIRRQLQRVVDGEGVSLAIATVASDQAVGLTWLGVRPQPGVIGLGYWIVPNARGQGFGTRAARLAAAWALDRAGMARVEAWVDPANLPSQRLLSSAGFTREGVLRSFLSCGPQRTDAIVFSRVASDA